MMASDLPAPVSGRLGFIYLSAILYWLSGSMMWPMIVLYFGSQGYTPAMIGFFLALNSVISLLFAMPLGGFIDRIGTKKAILIGYSLMAAAGLLFLIGGLQNTLPPILVGQVANGIGSLLGWGALQASMVISTNQTPLPGKKDHLLANFTFINSIAQFAGPVLGGLLSDLGGYVLVFALYALINIVSFFLGFLLPERRRTESQTKEIRFEFWKTYRSGYQMVRSNRAFTMAVVLFGTLFILVDIRGTFFPIYLSEKALSNTQVGLLLSVSGLASVLIRPFVGWLIEWIGHHWLILSSIVMGSICLVALAFNPGIYILTIIIFVWGMCMGVNQPIALIMISNTVEANKQGMSMNILTMSTRLVQFTNPLVFGFLSGIVGLAGGFGIIGVLLMIFCSCYNFYIFPRISRSKSSHSNSGGL